MASFYRDMAILALAIVAGVLWMLYSLVTRRGHRMAERERRLAMEQPPSPMEAPIAGLAEYASTHGWQGPTSELGTERLAGDYVHDMLRNLWGVPRQQQELRVGGPWFADLYTGQAGGRPFLVGNAWINVTGTEHPGSVCVLHLGEALPPLFVNPKPWQPFMRLGMKEMPFESEAFDRRYRVMALDRKYTMDMVSERTMEILMEREDWAFALEVDRLVCVAKSGLTSVQDYTARLDVLARFAALIPRFVEQDRAAQMPTLPDGTVLDIGDPASLQKFKEAVVAMSPEQRDQFLAQARVSGARFLAGMFGKDLPPGIEERLLAGFPGQEGAPPPDPTHEGSDPPSGG